MRFFGLSAAKVLSLCAALACQVSAAPSSPASSKHVSKRDFGPVTVYTPPSTFEKERSLYGRSVVLSDKTILATSEIYDPSADPNKSFFPIFRSADQGKTWKQISQAKDQVNNWGFRYQPFLYELPAPFGGFPAGTVLLAGNSIPKDLSKTQLDLYASTDKGLSWKFVSHIAAGGKALPNNGLTPVWEPFLLLNGNQLICYYSDQRDSRYGQKMVHQVTSDLRAWGPVVDDVTYPVYDYRPGMPIVSKLPNGKYIMTYEFYGAKEGGFSVYYKISADPTKFGSATGVVLKATDGHVPVGSPYNVWSPAGGANGSIIVSASSDSDVFVNKGLGEPGSQWVRVKTNAPKAYSRSLTVGINRNTEFYIVAGGELNQGPTNKVTFTSQSI